MDLNKLTKAELVGIINTKTLGEIALREQISRLNGELTIVRRSSVSVTKTEEQVVTFTFQQRLAQAREEAMRTGRVTKVQP